MESAYIQDEIFNQKHFNQSPLLKGEYEDCTFNNCDPSSFNLSTFIFINCTFRECNLSLAIIEKSSFREVEFNGCKLLGLRFDTCNPFGLCFIFNKSVLNHSSFYKIKLQKIIFNDTQLSEADFMECDLTSAVLNNCNLADTVFHNTILEKADLATAYNYTINPEINRIKKAKFSVEGIPGLLQEYDIVITN